MLSAIRLSDQKKVLADDEEKGTHTYHCPDCQSIVILNKGLKKIAYFRHQRLTNCDNAGESEVHMKIKLDIYRHLKTKWERAIQFVDVEHRLKDILRADVYFETLKSKVAVEVQASSLTVADVYRRTSLYYSLGVYVLWVLPFEYERFYRYYSTMELAMDGVDADPGYYLRHSVKFKEYELGIAKLTYNYLTFWDLSHKKSKGFYVLKLSNAYSEDSEFFDTESNEEVFYPGKRLKMKKSIRSFLNKDFSDFDAKPLQKFEPTNSYAIPERLVLLFKDEKKKKGKS
ncbi:hypothetical protein GCM10023187_53410 [Nibrella viscosa]|uniref:Competence protein CoiA n=1 Tax=Nibrella viscosa TaxID=1084524 RepID=A0ABP8KZG7_9BACT